jgi:hypothetical protein
VTDEEDAFRTNRFDIVCLLCIARIRTGWMRQFARESNGRPRARRLGQRGFGVHSESPRDVFEVDSKAAVAHATEVTIL